MAITQPTYEFNGSAPTTWDQAITANIPQLMDGIVELGKYAKPTTEWLWSQKKYVNVGTDGRFHFDISYGAHDVNYTTTGLTTFGNETGAAAGGGSVQGGFPNPNSNDKTYLNNRDSLTRLTVDPVVIMTKAWITDFDLKKYENSTMDLIEEKTFRMANGLSHALDYETWASQAEGSSATVNVSGYYGASITYTALTLTAAANLAATPASRLFSLPSLIKVPFLDCNLTGGTGELNVEYAQIHGLSTAIGSAINKAWAPHIYVAGGSAGGTPQELNALGATDTRNGVQGALSGTGLWKGISGNTDAKIDTVLDPGDFCITVPSGTETSQGVGIPENLGALYRDYPIINDGDSATNDNKATGSLVNPTLADIDFMLEQMQVGNGLEIMVAVPPAGYSYLARDFFGATLGNSEGRPRVQGDGPMNDYGVNFGAQHFRHSGYNAIFYADPSMAGTWDHSMWFYDMEAIEWVCVDGFGPKIYPWQRIPYSTVDGMAKLMWCQRILRNPSATGVLLNCKWR